MPPPHRGSRIRRFLLCSVLVAGLLPLDPARAVDVVANPETPVEDPLPCATARAIFAARMQHWPNGEPIKVFVLPDHDAIHREFAKSKLHVFAYQLRRGWDQMAFSGTGLVPVTVDTVDEMLRRITETPGSIGYLPAEWIDSRVHPVTVEPCQ